MLGARTTATADASRCACVAVAWGLHSWRKLTLHSWLVSSRESSWNENIREGKVALDLNRTHELPAVKILPWWKRVIRKWYFMHVASEEEFLADLVLLVLPETFLTDNPQVLIQKIDKRTKHLNMHAVIEVAKDPQLRLSVYLSNRRETLGHDSGKLPDPKH